MQSGIFQRLMRQWNSPPVWLGLFVCLGALQARWLPLWPGGVVSGWIGAALIGAGLALFTAAGIGFARARTTILPGEAPRAIITGGVYRVSRNPIYLADALILAGLVLRWDIGGLILVPAFMAVIQRRFIRAEEAGLQTLFAAEYARFAARTRRWL